MLHKSTYTHYQYVAVHIPANALQITNTAGKFMITPSFNTIGMRINAATVCETKVDTRQTNEITIKTAILGESIGSTKNKPQTTNHKPQTTNHNIMLRYAFICIHNTTI